MLAALATSALIVLRPRWSLAVLALCAAAPALIHLVRPDLPIPLGVSLFYLGFSVVFRASIQFTLVWLVAATHQLAQSREALAQEAVEIERARVEADDARRRWSAGWACSPTPAATPAPPQPMPG